MRKIYYELDIGFCGCGDEGVIEVADDMIDSEIDEIVENMAHEWADSWEGDSRLGYEETDDEEELEQQREDFRSGVSGWWREATAQEIEDYQGR